VKKMKVRTATALATALAGCGTIAPTLGVVEPGLICDEQGGATLHLEGTALEPAVQQALGDDPTLLLPTVRLEPAGGTTQGSPASAAQALEVDPSRITWIAPSSVDIRVDGGLGLEPGSWDVVVDTRTGHEARMDTALTVLGPPELETAEPARICHESETLAVTLAGQGFLLLDDGSVPSVTVDSIEATVLEGVGCEPLAGPVPGELCSGLEIEIAPGSLALGGVELSLTNPALAACSAASPLSLEVVLPPDIEAVEPAVVCASGGTIQVSGGPFHEGIDAELGGVPVEAVTLVDSGLIEIAVGADAPLGPADLTLLDPSGCTATRAEAFTVVTQPQAFHVDPPVVPHGRSLTASAMLADVNDDISDAWLVHESSGERRDIDWSWSEDRPSEIELIVPADLSTGTWRLGLEQAGSCEGILSAGFEVVTQPRVAVDSVEPPHAWTFDHTAIEIVATDPVPAGSVGFEDVPGVYLLGPAGSDRSESLLAVRYHDQQRITAVVPPNFDPGSYDLLVVNSDGAWGLLEASLEVTWDAPPAIDSVSPGTLEKGGDEQIAIHGSDFRDPVVELVCRESGVESTVSAVVERWSYGEIEASVSTRGFNQALCVVRVTNDDGNGASWSAISITNPAQNLFPFELGTQLMEARRAPAAAAGRTTSMDRWVYAIGGDAGDATSASSTVELAPVDAYGTMDAWTLLPQGLPEPRTLAGAVTVGRFVYLVGGDDGTAPLATVLRAMVLDPIDVPWLDSVSLDSVDDGLGEGRWTYRVAALYDASHDTNPDGEGLAGEPASITLPAVEGGWAPTLCWNAVDDAAGYRIYRSAEADAPSAEMHWLTDVVATTCFQDSGGAVDLSLEPLPEGALGSWATVATLHTARSAPCLAVAQDPATDPEIFHLYVAGGMAADGLPLDSIEVVDITVEGERIHSAGSPWTLEQALSEPRWQCAGYTVDETHHSVVGEERWVFFAGGLGERGATGTVDRGMVDSDGVLGSWGSSRSMTPARAGFGHASASDFLYAFGGQQGEPSASGSSAEIRDEGELELHNWNSLGSSMHLARYLPGSAQESAIIFVLGGQTDTADASTTTEFTHY
jgi:hypothetical protein